MTKFVLSKQPHKVLIDDLLIAISHLVYAFTELLRRSAEQTLMDMVQLLFSRYEQCYSGKLLLFYQKVTLTCPNLIVYCAGCHSSKKILNLDRSLTSGR